MAYMRQAVELTLGAETYALRFTTNSICALIDKYGDGVNQIVSRNDVVATRALLWALLLPSMPNITVEQAGDIRDIDPDKADDAVFRAYCMHNGIDPDNLPSLEDEQSGPLTGDESSATSNG